MEASDGEPELDRETRMILKGLNDFIDGEVRPIQADLGELYSNPRRGRRDNGQPVPEIVEAVEEIRRKSAEAGYYAMNMPRDVGGEGVSNLTWYLAKSIVASSGIGLAEYVLKGPEGPNPMLLQAEGDQAEKYLLPLVRAEKSAAFAQTEPGVGSDSPNMTTRAHRDGDDWVINGQKQWITNAAFCDFAQVLARTTPVDEAGRYRGITCFLVDRDEFEIGSVNNAVGFGGWQAEILLNDVRVPESRVLGEVDEAFYNAMAFLSEGRMELGAEAVGHTDYLLDRCVDYAREREAFGRPIGKFQQISSKIARGRAKHYVADAAGRRLARRIDRGEEAVEESSSFHWFATRTFWEVADDAVQVHGAGGLSEENPFMEHLHLARTLRIVEGTDEIQLNTIARQNGLL